MRVVLDANAAVEVALEGKSAGPLSAMLSQSQEVIAPELLVPEIINAIGNTISSRSSIWVDARRFSNLP